MTITLNGTLGVTSPGFTPTSSTVPVSGFYLPSANTVGLPCVVLGESCGGCGLPHGACEVMGLGCSPTFSPLAKTVAAPLTAEPPS